MGQALYRKNRPKRLEDVVGQEHITTALTHALQSGNICHAYLFTGPRGVGKTSIARILAHEINALPYSSDRQHLDIIEIDAASNRRIDEIRDLRDKVHIAPTSAKYKVYIIDEVHMLTKEAFNALLKTLEEPPAHVVFILATTEAHKLPETIVSRTQRYAFKPVDQTKVVDHLRQIANLEKIDISDDALELIAAHGEGSFRDSISLLDQIRNTKGKVELTDVQSVLGIAPAELITTIVQAIASHESVAVAQNILQMHSQGYEPAQISRQLSSILREQLIQGSLAIPSDTALALLTHLVEVPASHNPRAALEIALLDATFAGLDRQAPPPVVAPQPSSKIETRTKSVQHDRKIMPEGVQDTKPAVQIDPRKEPVAQHETPTKKVKPASTDEESIGSMDTSTDIILTEEAWDLILNAIKQKHNTLFSMLRTAAPQFEPGKVILEFSFAFHQKRFSEARNKKILGEVISGVTGSDVQIQCILGEGRLAPAPTTPLPPTNGEMVHSAAPNPSESKSKSSVDVVSNIFGGAELLES